MLVTQLKSLENRPDDISRFFFHNICNPTFCFYHMLPLCRTPMEPLCSEFLLLFQVSESPRSCIKKYGSFRAYKLWHQPLMGINPQFATNLTCTHCTLCTHSTCICLCCCTQYLLHYLIVCHVLSDS